MFGINSFRGSICVVSTRWLHPITQLEVAAREFWHSVFASWPASITSVSCHGILLRCSMSRESNAVLTNACTTMVQKSVRSGPHVAWQQGSACSSIPRVGYPPESQAYGSHLEVRHDCIDLYRYAVVYAMDDRARVRPVESSVASPRSSFQARKCGPDTCRGGGRAGAALVLLLCDQM